MPWERRSIMSQREDFVRFYEETGNMAEACRLFEITRKTGYKWWNRYTKDGLEGLKNRSKRPHSNPNKTPDKMEKNVLDVRRQQPDWGGRKIRRYLLDQGYKTVPAASTITRILKRHDQIDPEESEKRIPYKRFEADRPNECWQMDFKGHFKIEGGRCHPLTILDDHSRYSVGLQACLNETRHTVQQHLRKAFETHGLPKEMLLDNGRPWGQDVRFRHTQLTVWLMEMGIHIIHSSPYHPETLGKVERFHRTFKEAIQTTCEGRIFKECQPLFDTWRSDYNQIRPHEALDMAVPAARYEISPRKIPKTILPWDYPKDYIVRKVSQSGNISLNQRFYQIGVGFHGKHIGLEETQTENVVNVKFREFKVNSINLKNDVLFER